MKSAATKTTAAILASIVAAASADPARAQSCPQRAAEAVAELGPSVGKVHPDLPESSVVHRPAGAMRRLDWPVPYVVVEYSSDGSTVRPGRVRYRLDRVQAPAEGRFPPVLAARFRAAYAGAECFEGGACGTFLAARSVGDLFHAEAGDYGRIDIGEMVGAEAWRLLGPDQREGGPRSAYLICSYNTG